MQRYGHHLERMISPEGYYTVVGRSSTYRNAAFQPLASLALDKRLPEDISEGQVRSALTSVLKNVFVERTFKSSGWLSIGVVGDNQENIADTYTNAGSIQTILHRTLSLSEDFVDSNLNSAVKQIKYLAESINTDEIPTTFNNGKHINFGTGWWCSGFYPGKRKIKSICPNRRRKNCEFYLTITIYACDLIPYWDMDQDKLTVDSPYYNNRRTGDASTAAIIASALLELSTYSKGKESQNYIEKSSKKWLISLSGIAYKASYKDAGGFILVHSVGSVPHKTEVDVPLTRESVTARQIKLDIILNEQTKDLDDSSGVGYGTRSRQNVGGAVISVDKKLLKDRPVTNNGLSALTGAAPGLVLKMHRWFIIDGVEGDINTLNPNDIEDLTILEDAEHLQDIYGAKAGGGVIVVRTKAEKQIRKHSFDTIRCKLGELLMHVPNC
ncbi:hypothetical protein FQR65_LT15211 [Abscondita terminalis]|nr:hypothetical protein FQR65_LT15211 [Abscondita terminalis]